MVRVPNWLGDAVMALPALGELRRIFSQSATGVDLFGCAQGLRPLVGRDERGFFDAFSERLFEKSG